jgi:UPF0176 protein
MSATTPAHRIAALYRFCRLDRFETLRAPIAERCRQNGIRGTLLLAPEGLNGTVAGTPQAIDELVALLESIPEFGSLDVKYSASAGMPFHRMKVRLKQEIVTLGVAGIDPARDAGTRIGPADWNALISDPRTVVVDTRNAYEISLGSFRGAVDPRTSSFREFPDFVQRRRGELEGRRIAMFCTGGIRCEKATAYMRSLGFADVFHLDGGILKYLEEVPEEESLWAGECFVFDERVSVMHGLRVGEAELCRACRHPLTAAGRKNPAFREGVSCEHCIGSRTDADRRRYAERQRQVELAAARGRTRHIGR